VHIRGSRRRSQKRESMRKARSKVQLEEDLCIHIFVVSAAMVGVCLTAIGLIHVVIAMRSLTTVADDLLVVDALLFLCACLVSYWALRTRGSRRLHQLERLADLVFIAGLMLMAGVCALLVYALGQVQRP
jgi:drug/metabolite transporter (DMT)-like permease